MVKAKIVDDLRSAMASPAALGDDFYIYYEDDEFDRLRRRIEGKVVDIKFCDGDAFEVIDDNIWLPDNCYEVIDDNICRNCKYFDSVYKNIGYCTKISNATSKECPEFVGMYIETDDEESKLSVIDDFGCMLWEYIDNE